MIACRNPALRTCSHLMVCARGSTRRDLFRLRQDYVIRRPYSNHVSAAELQFGQPLHETHPHLLNPGELTRGISALEYAERRTRLAKALPPGSIAVLAAADVKFRSGAVFYEFQQEANFFYLTGFDEPEAVAVIGKSADGDDHHFHLFVRPKDPKVEMWEGSRSGPQAALDVFNADETGDVNSLRSLLPPILSDAKEIFTDIPIRASNTNIGSFFARFFGYGPNPSKDSFAGMVADKKVKPLKSIMNGLRALKSADEIRVMRQAGQASGRAITAAMKRQWRTEKELAAFLAHEFNVRGCDNDAYIPVVAGGENALGIHYTFNNKQLNENEMILVDAGGQIGHYITDITRTWPLGRRFSPAQKDLYNAVLSVQRACVSLCRENAAVSLDRLHEIAESGLKANLADLGFDMSGKAIESLFPHHVGHYVGLDVHDIPGYPRTDRLITSNVITIEPGVYVTNDERWPKHFRGTGIRIEDSVAVQSDSPLILTTEAVKEVDDIEAILGTGLSREETLAGGPLYNNRS